MTIDDDAIESIDVSEGTLKLLETRADFKLHALETIHEIGDLGWREAVLEYCLHIRQRFLIGRQSDRL